MRNSQLLAIVLPFALVGHALRWCVRDSGLNQQLCDEMEQDLRRKNTTLHFRCVYGLHQVDCMQQIRNGAADAMNLNAEEIYAAGHQLGLKVALFEEVRGRSFTHQTLVVVRRSSMSSAKLQSLNGKRLCLPGVEEDNLYYHTLTDVLLPLGMVESKYINCQSPARTIASFFGASCMPGRWAGSNKGAQCALCNDDCSQRDQYSGALGALRCLVEKNADLAVTSDTALAMSTALSSTKFKLLCLQGNFADLDEQCPWLKRRSNAVVVSPLAKADRQQMIKDSVRKVFKAFNKTRPVWLRKLILSTSNVTHYGEAHAGGFSYKRYLGNLFVKTMQSPFSSNDCSAPRLQMCLTNSNSMKKCRDISIAWSSIRIKPPLLCQHADSHLQFDAVYAYVNHDLVPLAIEAGRAHAKSYLLAVIKRGRALTPGRLYGVKACFSSLRLRDTVLVLLQRLNILRIESCEFENVGNDFFASACQGEGWRSLGGDSLCSLCKNAAAGNKIWQYGAKNGTRSDQDDADVAFLELHHDKMKELQYASNAFVLVCPNGTRKGVETFAQCNWLTTTGSAIVGSRRRLSTNARVRLAELLVHVQRFYEKKKVGDKFTMFHHPLEEHSLFDKHTTSLQGVWPSKEDEDYDNLLANAFGNESFAIYKTLALCTSGNHYATPRLILIAANMCLLEYFASLRFG